MCVCVCVYIYREAKVVPSAYRRLLISPSNLDSSLWFIQPGILHDVLCKHVGLDKLQAGIKIGGRNINNLRYVDDTTLMAKSKEELKEPLGEGEGGE